MAEDSELIALRERNNWLEELSQVRAGVIADKEERIRTLESACEAALETFQSVQWINRGDHFSCGGCGNWSESGHHPECHVKLAIEQLEGAINK